MEEGDGKERRRGRRMRKRRRNWKEKENEIEKQSLVKEKKRQNPAVFKDASRKRGSLERLVGCRS